METKSIDAPSQPATQGWPVRPDEHGTGIIAPFNAPGLGPQPWFVYRITPTAATSVTHQGESTRWTF